MAEFESTTAPSSTKSHSPLSQEEKRRKRLDEQRRARDRLVAAHRSEPEDEPNALKAATVNTELQPHQLLTVAEVMLEVPSDLADKWVCAPCPIGTRCALVSKSGSCRATTTTGEALLHDFKSKLPSGTILDCIFNPSSRTFVALDVIKWKEQWLAEGTTFDFRNFWLQSKLSELQIDAVNGGNEFSIVPVQRYDCSRDGIVTVNDLARTMGGSDIVFNHIESDYETGNTTPLVLLLIEGQDEGVNISSLLNEEMERQDGHSTPYKFSTLLSLIVLLLLLLSVGAGSSPRSVGARCSINPSRLLAYSPGASTDLSAAREQSAEQSLVSSLSALHKTRNSEAVIALFEEARRSRTLAPYKDDRLSFNMALQALLRTKRDDAAEALLSEVRLSGSRLAPDTVHILISDAFRRGNTARADELFAFNFVHGQTVPTLRTFNIMIEGHRSQGNWKRAMDLYSSMDEFGIVPDLYSQSSLIRMSTSASEIVEIVSRAARETRVNPPFVRCAVETLGKLGFPSQAIEVSLSYLSGNSSVFSSSRSGAALITALLSETSKNLDVQLSLDNSSVTLKAHIAAFLLAGVKEVLFEKPINLGTRGFTLLFSQLYDLAESGVIDQANYVLFRDQLWLNARNLLLRSVVSVDGQKVELSVVDGVGEDDTEEDALVLNGRLSYALLRCYANDIVSAKALWKKELLPLASKAADPTAVLQLSAEALMFCSGQCADIDTALELARSARKRKWSADVLSKLARQFYAGRLAGPSSTIWAKSLEVSLFAELGFDVTAEERGRQKFGGITKIRLRLK